VEAGVDAGQVEGGRVEVRRVFEAEPLEPSLVLLVGRVGDRLLQVGVTPGTTAVLGRAGSLPRQVRRDRGGTRTRIRRENLLQLDLVISVIAELVEVAQPVPRPDEHVC
jgi:hypothetical protein